MIIHPNEILDLIKKERRPLLRDEVWRRLGIESEQDFEKLTIVPDDQAEEPVKIYVRAKKGSTSNVTLNDLKANRISTLSNYTEIRDEPYLFTADLLEEFWLSEILYILRKVNDEVELSTIIDGLKTKIIDYYGLKDPLGKSFNIIADAGLGKEEKWRLLRFLDKPNSIFYHYSGQKSLTTMVGLKEWEGRVLENDMKKIRNEMIRVLRNDTKEGISLKDLTYAINRSKLDTLTHKPYDVELIKNIVNESRGRVIYDISKETISLSDDLQYITNYFKENRQPFDQFNFPQGSSGLLAYIFIGKEFPLKEATEYVKTRPIIFIDEVLLRTSENLIVHQELMEYLETSLETTDSEEIQIWLSENVVISYYEEGLSQVKLLTPKIIEKLSPVFNVDRNPGNLFQYTLKTLLEEYNNKNPDKILPF